ncbi:MAG: CBS domain-containing protein [Hyphomicrobiaceae bacterium]
MTNRKLMSIVQEQKPIVLASDSTMLEACRLMADHAVGSILVVDKGNSLVGILTGRDVVRALALGLDAGRTLLGQVMTRDPATITPDKTAIDALRMMWDGGYRHLPVVDGGRVLGVLSRGDFKGVEIDRMDLEQHLWETIR